MNRKELTARREGFMSEHLSQCKYPNGKLRSAWMSGFEEGQDFLKRVAPCPICYEIGFHAPGCPKEAEQEADE
jgi:hypothetical protein